MSGQNARGSMKRRTCRTGQQRVVVRKVSTEGPRGAPPETTNRTLPPKAALTVFSTVRSMIGLNCTRHNHLRDAQSMLCKETVSVPYSLSLAQPDVDAYMAVGLAHVSINNRLREAQAVW